MIKLLYENGSSPYLQNKNGLNSEEYAQMKNNCEIITYLQKII